MLLALVDELCAASPTVMVLDDLQWADEASLTVWHRLTLAANQLPILLIGACHPAPRRPEVQALRAAVRRHGGSVIPIGPLSEIEVDALATSLAGAAPQGSAIPLLASATGNPLYLRELIIALGQPRIPATGLAKTAFAPDVLTDIGKPWRTTGRSDRWWTWPERSRTSRRFSPIEASRMKPKKALNEAIDYYGTFAAAWDIGRAERRLRTLGIRRGVHGARPQRPARDIVRAFADVGVTDLIFDPSVAALDEVDRLADAVL